MIGLRQVLFDKVPVFFTPALGPARSPVLFRSNNNKELLFGNSRRNLFHKALREHRAALLFFVLLLPSKKNCNKPVRLHENT